MKVVVICLFVFFVVFVAYAVLSAYEMQKQVNSSVLANHTFSDYPVSDYSGKVRWNVEGKDYDVPCFADNLESKDGTYEDLMVFLKEDLTDRMIVLSDDSLNSCERYSVTLHDNAEKKGIRCGYAIVTFVEIDEVYGRFGHALCVFNTKDKGQIYIDDTLSPTVDVEKTVDLDKTGKVVVGQKYTPNRLFDGTKYKAMGTVESVDVYWNELDE